MPPAPDQHTHVQGTSVTWQWSCHSWVMFGQHGRIVCNKETWIT